ncbi:mitochondrial import receptor subunit TOM7 homolog isoform X2 [Sphaerodactylus townsendi]|nr:mitochondrial import receptor subunit TOM7 homolog isoform X2 [Sphaerodactylus townsendi]
MPEPTVLRSRETASSERPFRSALRLYTIMQILPRLFLFSLLLATGSFLECEVCSSPGSTCSGARQRCHERSATCAIITIENTLENITVLTVAKDCESSDVCMNPGKSMNFGHGRIIRSYSSCCIEESCAIEVPKLMPVATKPNGIQCPGCFSPGESCVSDIVACTGDQNHCFKIVSSARIGGEHINVIMKVCATKNVCLAVEQGRASPVTGSDLFLKQGSCRPKASGGPQITGLLFPTISGFLLMKMVL